MEVNENPSVDSEAIWGARHVDITAEIYLFLRRMELKLKTW
jgi:hypothetical protein